MNTRNIPGSKCGRCVRLTTYHHTGPSKRNPGTLTSQNPLELYRPLTGQRLQWASSLNTRCSSLMYILIFGAKVPCWAMTPSFTKFLDHTQRRTTVGRTPLHEWSVRRTDLYITTHNTHNRQTTMPRAGFESTISASERPKTDALDRAATGTGSLMSAVLLLLLLLLLITLIELSPCGSSPYTNTDKTNKNKYT